MFNDKSLTCRDCGAQFTFSASEQEFFAEKGFTNEPTRCPSCRSAHRNGGAQNNRGSNRSMGHNTERPMYDVICDGCGAATKVPFQPRGDRPVYCRDCFNKQNPR